MYLHVWKECKFNHYKSNRNIRYGPATAPSQPVINDKWFVWFFVVSCQNLGLNCGWFLWSLVIFNPKQKQARALLCQIINLIEAATKFSTIFTLITVRIFTQTHDFTSHILSDFWLISWRFSITWCPSINQIGHFYDQLPQRKSLRKLTIYQL